MDASRRAFLTAWSVVVALLSIIIALSSKRSSPVPSAGNAGKNETLRVVTQTVNIVHTSTNTITRDRIVTNELRIAADPTVLEALFKLELDSEYVTPKDTFGSVTKINAIVTIADVIKESVVESDIQTQVELELRKAGIALGRSSALPTLLVSIEGLWDDQHTQATLVFSAELMRNVLVPSRPPVWCSATVWSTSRYGYAGRNRLRDSIEKAVEKLTADFCNIWLTYHRQGPDWVPIR